MSHKNCPSRLKNRTLIFVITTLFLTLTFGYLLSDIVYAQTSDEINLQGKIVRNDTGYEGLNVVNGTPTCVASGADTCDFQVKYYDASTGGTLEYTETFADVEIGDYNGVFNLSLGSVTGSGNYSDITDLLSNEDTIYLQIEFAPGGAGSYTEVFTRTQLNASAYAIRSRVSEGSIDDSFKFFNSASSSGITTTTGSVYYDTTDGMLKVYNGSGWQAVSDNLWTDDGTYSYLTSTTDDLILGGSTPGTSKFFFDVSEGRLGIGTDTPSASIDIAGASSTISNDTGDITISPAGNLIIDQGNVGIGTSTLTRKLQLVADTTEAGGIGFGTDVVFYRSAANTLRLGAGDSLEISESDGGIGTTLSGGASGGIITVRMNGNAHHVINGAGETYFNEGGRSDTDFRIESDTLTHAFFVDASANAVGIGLSSPTAYLHLKAGTASAGTAPLKFTAGTNLGTAESGAMEWDGSNLFITDSTATRNTIAYTSDLTFTGLSDTPSAYTGSGSYLVRVNSGATGLEFVEATAFTDTNDYVDSVDFNTSTGVLTLGRGSLSDLTKDLDGRYLELSGGTLTGDLTVGSTSRAANTYIRALAGDSYNTGFEAYGSSQGTGYLFVGQSTTYGGGIYYNGDGSPAFATGESSDQISFYRKTSGTNEVVFSYPHNSNDVTFRGGITTVGITNNSTTLATRMASTSSTPTQIPVFIADPSGTTRTIVTRTPAQLRDDIGAGTGDGTVTNVATGTGLTGGLITTTGTISLDYSNTLASNSLTANTTLFGSTGVLFEGSTANTYETLLTVTDPTADRTITLPNNSGTVALTSDIPAGATYWTRSGTDLYPTTSGDSVIPNGTANLGASGTRWNYVYGTYGNFSTSTTTPLIVGSSSLALRPSSNSTTAIQLQNAAGTSILNVDTTNSRVGIGTTTTEYSLDVNSSTDDNVARFSSTDNLAKVYIEDNDSRGYLGVNDSKLSLGLESEQYYTVTSQESYPSSVFFSSDGSLMYVIGIISDTVFQYNLSTAWDVSTASYASKSFSVSSQESSPSSVVFSSNGTIMYIVGYTNNTVYQYSLSTAWDVSTASYASKSYDVSSKEDEVNTVAFSSSGTKMYIGGYGSSIFEYTLSTAWDVSSASYSNSGGFWAYYPLSVYFNSDGTLMYIASLDEEEIRQYSLSTGWDITTASYSGKSYDISTEDTSPESVFFSSDGSLMYVTGSDNDTVFQYNLSTAWDVSTANYEDTEILVLSDEGYGNNRLLTLSGDFQGGTNNAYDIGSTSTRWKDVYTQGSISVGANGDSGSIRYNTTNDELEFTNDGSNWIPLGDLTVTEVLSAEYAGAVMAADGSSNTGSMTSDAEGSTSNSMNYYEWNSSETGLQDYDVRLRYTIPSDFDSWATNAFTLNFATEANSSTNNKVDIYVYLESSGTIDDSSTGQYSSSAGVWTTTNIQGADLGDCNAVGETCLILMRMYSANDSYTRIGDIDVNYNRKL